MKPIKTYKDLSDLNSYKEKYAYQEFLTKVLDKSYDPFDEHLINKIALWKVNRYYRLDDSLLNQINYLKDLKKGEHRKAEKVIEDMLGVPGVDIAMASTILRFRNPETFQIIDKRAYRMVFGEPLKLYHSTKSATKIDTYFKYMDALIKISKNLHVEFQLLDRLLYQADIEENRGLNLS